VAGRTKNRSGQYDRGRIADGTEMKQFLVAERQRRTGGPLRRYQIRSSPGANADEAFVLLALFCMDTITPPTTKAGAAETERLAYSLREAADLLGVDYFSVYRLIQRGKIRACRALRGKLLVPRSELLRLLKG
jgi:excisionase family DNA binding protein